MGQLASFTRVLVVCVHTHQTRTVYARNPHKPIYALGHDEWRLGGDLGFAKFRSRELEREKESWILSSKRSIIKIIIITYKTLVVIDIE